MLLIKLGEEYKLYSHDSCVATTHESPYKKLSKQNCDEIFGVVDVDKFADEYIENEVRPQIEGENQKIRIGVLGGSIIGFKKGFQKAMELNKDKLFTAEDVRKAIYLSWDNSSLASSHIIESLQPKEIEVEIEMICPHPSDTYKCGLEFGCDEDVCNNPNRIPYLDKNSCLILKRK